MTKIEAEVARTMSRLETAMSADGAYVWISDSDCSWWQPVAKLLPILEAMPDYAEPEDGDADVLGDDYSHWCHATIEAGFFGHNSGGDTMREPRDFRLPEGFYGED